MRRFREKLAKHGGFVAMDRVTENPWEGLEGLWDLVEECAAACGAWDPWVAGLQSMGLMWPFSSSR